MSRVVAISYPPYKKSPGAATTPEQESDGFDEMRDALKCAENPYRKHRQAHRTDEKRNGQKNQSVLWGVCSQDHYSEKRDYAAGDSEQHYRAGDNPHADECEQVDGQNDWRGQ